MDLSESDTPVSVTFSLRGVHSGVISTEASESAVLSKKADKWISGRDHARLNLKEPATGAVPVHVNRDLKILLTGPAVHAPQAEGD